MSEYHCFNKSCRFYRNEIDCMWDDEEHRTNCPLPTEIKERLIKKGVNK